tara:strand:+ start:412 stop:1188 length:777 start_codon:yes stop_codon:yes gene_type:complete
MKALTIIFWWLFSWISIFIFLILLGSFLDNTYLGIFLFIILAVSYYYMVFRNQNERVKKANSKLLDYLIDGESVIVKGLDTRPFALFKRRQIFAVTNSRIIRLERGLLGGFEMLDYQWKDLRDAQISENVFPSITGSTLSFTFQANSEEPIEVYPDVEVASKAYRHSQQEEQAWEEKRRVRDMEEKRAESGGVFIGQSSNPIQSNNSTTEIQNKQQKPKFDITDELFKLKKLLDEGILSDAEFQEMKSKILSRNSQNF